MIFIVKRVILALHGLSVINAERSQAMETGREVAAEMRSAMVARSSRLTF